MSRSYRKNWILTDNSGSPYKKWAKRQANKCVRRTKKVQDGCWYRKLYESWNICDWCIAWGDDYMSSRIQTREWRMPEHYNGRSFDLKSIGLAPTPFWKYRNK